MSISRHSFTEDIVTTAARADADAILSLVGGSGLPLAGLTEHLERFPDSTVVLRTPDGAVTGCAALETYGNHGLLRSLAVVREGQSKGRGTTLVTELLQRARAAGLDEVFLLTETAAPFFAGLGFLPVARSAVPDGVRASREFASVCPAHAQVLGYPLGPEGAGQAVRPANLGDLETMAGIYNQGIDDRLATFETRPRTARDLAAWFDGRHPTVVVRSSRDGIGAFAATFEYRSRACYAGIAEFSVYTARALRGEGYGRLAMEGLIAAAERAGFWKLIARVFVENAASRRLLGRLGFREVGIYERHGRLDGQWRDVVVIERLLGEAVP